jgi:hypothetical protein
MPYMYWLPFIPIKTDGIRKKSGSGKLTVPGSEIVARPRFLPCMSAIILGSTAMPYECMPSASSLAKNHTSRVNYIWIKSESENRQTRSLREAIGDEVISFRYSPARPELKGIPSREKV